MLKTVAELRSSIMEILNAYRLSSKINRISLTDDLVGLFNDELITVHKSPPVAKDLFTKYAEYIWSFYLVSNTRWEATIKIKLPDLSMPIIRLAKDEDINELFEKLSLIIETEVNVYLKRAKGE